MVSNVPYIEDILLWYKPELDVHYQRIRNHAFRIYHLSLLQSNAPLSKDERCILGIAAGIQSLPDWTAHKGEPSTDPGILLIEFLASHDLMHLAGDIAPLIGLQGKQQHLGRDKLQEIFRRAYWTDISKGRQNFGLPRSAYQRLIKLYPSRGYHWLNLIRTADPSGTDSRMLPGAIR